MGLSRFGVALVSDWLPSAACRIACCIGGIALLSLASCRPAPEDRQAPDSIIGSSGKAPGQFFSPRAVAANGQRGEVTVVDRSGRIQRFLWRESTSASATASGIKGKGRWELANLWRLPDSLLGQPTGLRHDAEGNLLVADTHYQRVLVFDPETGRELRRWGSAGSGDGQFTQIRSVVTDSKGNVYASDYGGDEDRIQKFTSRGDYLGRFGRRGGKDGEFERPQGLAIARELGGGETLLVADSCNHRVQRFSLEGEFLSSWGSEGDASGKFRYPYGIAVDSKPGGDIFVVEWGNNRVQRFDAEGVFVDRLGRPGHAPGEFLTPWDIDLDADGQLYVVDFGNHRVQVFAWPESVARLAR